MSETRKGNYPYKQLGAFFKRMRQKKQESLDEVSGAVEIDTEHLSEIERGAKRPSEDILLLLISYFSVNEDEAVKVWEMAGYDQPDDKPVHGTEEVAQPVLVMPMDARIVYTDLAHISSNKYGLTINFLQSDGIGNKPLAVSRIGMSREHAEKLLKTLEKALKTDGQKLLPAPESKNEENQD